MFQFTNKDSDGENVLVKKNFSVLLRFVISSKFFALTFEFALMKHKLHQASLILSFCVTFIIILYYYILLEIFIIIVRTYSPLIVRSADDGDTSWHFSSVVRMLHAVTVFLSPRSLYSAANEVRRRLLLKCIEQNARTERSLR